MKKKDHSKRIANENKAQLLRKFFFSIPLVHIWNSMDEFR